MYTWLAVLVYAVAIGIPVYLLYRFHSQTWYWHVLAIVASLSLGLIPMPAEFQKKGFDLAFGFLFVFLLSWGAGGLIAFHSHRPHYEKHA